MNTKLDRIMAVVCPRCNHLIEGHGKDYQDCPLGLVCDAVKEITAILSRPQVIVVDGIEWKPSEYTAVNDAMSSIVYLSNLSEEDLWKWDVMPVPPTGETYDTLDAALAAASREIKGETK